MTSRARRRYRVELKPSAARALAKLPKPALRRVAEAIDALTEEPRPRGARKLTGAPDLYRIRVGDYRVIYAIEDRVLLVLVVALGHRQEVYR